MKKVTLKVNNGIKITKMKIGSNSDNESHPYVIYFNSIKDLILIYSIFYV